MSHDADDMNEVAEHMERVFTALEDDGSRYIDMMFAAYLRTFGPMFGNDPEAFLLDLVLVVSHLPSGQKAYHWASKWDLFGDDEDDDDEEPEAGWVGPQCGPAGTRIA